jgi:5'-hydroxyaverantin dehydrogenase
MTSIKLSPPVSSAGLTSLKTTTLPDLVALKGKSVLITSGSTGLGAALARRCAEAGAWVTIADIKDAEGQALVAEQVEKGLHAEFVHCDVHSWTEQVAAFRSAVRFSPEGDTLDHLFINDGSVTVPFMMGEEQPKLTVASLDADPGPAPDVTPIQINTIGSAYSLKLAQRYMLMPTKSGQGPASRGKSIMFFLTSEAYFSLAGFIVYGASKFGERALFRTARDPFAALGIRVNAISAWIMEIELSVPIAPMLKANGLHFVDVQLHADVALRMACDEGIAGRVIAVCQSQKTPATGDGTLVDLRDDEEGMDAGPQWWAMLRGDGVPKARAVAVSFYKALGFDIDPDIPHP